MNATIAGIRLIAVIDMKTNLYWILGILLLLGCVSAQSALVDIQSSDQKWIKEGALLPENLSQLYSYKADLIEIQKKITSGIGADKDGLNVLLNAKIAMAEAQENVLKGLNAYNLIGSSTDCSQNSNAKKAGNYFSAASKKAGIAAELQKTFNSNYADALKVEKNTTIVTVMDALKESAKRYSDGIQSLCQ